MFFLEFQKATFKFCSILFDEIIHMEDLELDDAPFLSIDGGSGEFSKKCVLDGPFESRLMLKHLMDIILRDPAEWLEPIGHLPFPVSGQVRFEIGGVKEDGWVE